MPQPLWVALAEGGGFVGFFSLLGSVIVANSTRATNRIAIDKLALDTESARAKASADEKKALIEENERLHDRLEEAEATVDEERKKRRLADIALQVSDDELRRLLSECRLAGQPCQDPDRLIIISPMRPGRVIVADPPPTPASLPAPPAPEPDPKANDP